MTTPEKKHPGDKFLVPELNFLVSRTVSLGNISSLSCFSKTPTLAELRRICAYAHGRQFSAAERGEWTADFVDYNIQQPDNLPLGYILAKYISRPTKVYLQDDKWITEGGTEKPVLLPPMGWVIPNAEGKFYDEETGLPYATIFDMENPGSPASADAFFWRIEPGGGLRAVNRECERITGLHFEVSTTQDPNFSHHNIGFREIIFL